MADTDTCYSQHLDEGGGYCGDFGKPPIYTDQCDKLGDTTNFPAPWTGDGLPPRGKISIDYSVPLNRTGYCDN